jgi:excisionase family DNA binding protein
MSTTPATNSPRLARLMTIAEVADALGVDVRHVRRLVHERRIPYIKWGHLLRFDPADIAGWVDACRRHPSRPQSSA